MNCEQQTAADELIHALGLLARAQEYTPDSPAVAPLATRAQELHLTLNAVLADR